MPLTLENFETEVERKIVERGREYYRSGDIRKLEKVAAGEFSAVVFGTDKYSVYIKLNENKRVVEHECDCPYDFGDVCKHRIAVLYAIRSGDFSDASDKLSALLADTHDAALRKFVANLLKKDRDFRQEFLREFDEDLEEDEDDEFFDEDYY